MHWMGNLQCCRQGMLGRSLRHALAIAGWQAGGPQPPCASSSRAFARSLLIAWDSTKDSKMGMCTAVALGGIHGGLWVHKECLRAWDVGGVARGAVEALKVLKVVGLHEELERDRAAAGQLLAGCQNAGLAREAGRLQHVLAWLTSSHMRPYPIMATHQSSMGSSKTDMLAELGLLSSQLDMQGSWECFLLCGISE